MAIVVFSAQNNEFFRVLQALLLSLDMGGVAGVSAITAIQLYKQFNYQEALAWAISHTFASLLSSILFLPFKHSSRLVACPPFWQTSWLLISDKSAVLLRSRFPFIASLVVIANCSSHQHHYTSSFEMNRRHTPPSLTKDAIMVYSAFKAAASSHKFWNSAVDR
jgi:hypothetical protein